MEKPGYRNTFKKVMGVINSSAYNVFQGIINKYTNLSYGLPLDEEDPLDSYREKSRERSAMMSSLHGGRLEVQEEEESSPEKANDVDDSKLLTELDEIARETEKSVNEKKKQLGLQIFDEVNHPGQKVLELDSLYESFDDEDYEGEKTSFRVKNPVSKSVRNIKSKRDRRYKGYGSRRSTNNLQGENEAMLKVPRNVKNLCNNGAVDVESQLLKGSAQSKEPLDLQTSERWTRSKSRSISENIPSNFSSNATKPTIGETRIVDDKIICTEDRVSDKHSKSLKKLGSPKFSCTKKSDEDSLECKVTNKNYETNRKAKILPVVSENIASTSKTAEARPKEALSTFENNTSLQNNIVNLQLLLGTYDMCIQKTKKTKKPSSTAYEKDKISTQKKEVTSKTTLPVSVANSDDNDNPGISNEILQKRKNQECLPIENQSSQLNKDYPGVRSGKDKTDHVDGENRSLLKTTFESSLNQKDSEKESKLGQNRESSCKSKVDAILLMKDLSTVYVRNFNCSTKGKEVIEKNYLNSRPLYCFERIKLRSRDSESYEMSQEVSQRGSDKDSICRVGSMAEEEIGEHILTKENVTESQENLLDLSKQRTKAKGSPVSPPSPGSVDKKHLKVTKRDFKCSTKGKEVMEKNYLNGRPLYCFEKIRLRSRDSESYKMSQEVSQRGSDKDSIFRVGSVAEEEIGEHILTKENVTSHTGVEKNRHNICGLSIYNDSKNLRIIEISESQENLLDLSKQRTKAKESPVSPPSPGSVDKKEKLKVTKRKTKKERDSLRNVNKKECCKVNKTKTKKEMGSFRKSKEKSISKKLDKFTVETQNKQVESTSDANNGSQINSKGNGKDSEICDKFGNVIDLESEDEDTIWIDKGDRKNVEGNDSYQVKENNENEMENKAQKKMMMIDSSSLSSSFRKSEEKSISKKLNKFPLEAQNEQVESTSDANDGSQINRKDSRKDFEIYDQFGNVIDLESKDEDTIWIDKGDRKTVKGNNTCRVKEDIENEMENNRTQGKIHPEIKLLRISRKGKRKLSHIYRPSKREIQSSSGNGMEDTDMDDVSICKVRKRKFCGELTENVEGPTKIMVKDLDTSMKDHEKECRRNTGDDNHKWEKFCTYEDIVAKLSPKSPNVCPNLFDGCNPDNKENASSTIRPVKQLQNSLQTDSVCPEEESLEEDINADYQEEPMPLHYSLFDNISSSVVHGQNQSTLQRIKELRRNAHFSMLQNKGGNHSKKYTDSETDEDFITSLRLKREMSRIGSSSSSQLHKSDLLPE
ncbi:uncharacterized protein LOC143021814 [Oratosquilla oratoria]|uniref:uncharacterized protein LOC143021814 n=1 Tax=Oratosquilla oratoria TaxID=337810 RepID=UPI003F763E3C